MGTKITFTKEQIKIIANNSDKGAARILGCSSSRIKKERKKQGLKNPRTYSPWTEEQLALLGTMTDRELAEKLGKHHPNVTSKRKQLGVEPHGYRSKVWTEEQLALLGTAPDAEIAEILGCRVHIVSVKRSKLGIKAHRGLREWAQDEINLLGELTDTEVAIKLGLTQHQVASKRRRLGISGSSKKYSNNSRHGFDKERIKKIFEMNEAGISYNKIGLAFSISRQRVEQILKKFNGVDLDTHVPSVVGRKVIKIPEEHLSKLGKMTDCKFAELTGIESSTVSMKRKQLGIPSYQDYLFEQAKPVLGKMTDRLVAEKFGVTTTTVYSWRKSLNIKPHRKHAKLKGTI